MICPSKLRPCRSIEYSVNSGSSGHLPVKALVTHLSLTLSTHTLTLSETPLARQNSGMPVTHTCTTDSEPR